MSLSHTIETLILFVNMAFQLDWPGEIKMFGCLLQKAKNKRCIISKFKKLVCWGKKWQRHPYFCITEKFLIHTVNVQLKDQKFCSLSPQS